MRELVKMVDHFKLPTSIKSTCSCCMQNNNKVKLATKITIKKLRKKILCKQK